MLVTDLYLQFRKLNVDLERSKHEAIKFFLLLFKTIKKSISVAV